MNTKKGQQIVVPTDFSETGNCAILHGVELAKIYEKELTLIHIIDSSTSKLFKSPVTEADVKNTLDSIAGKTQAEHNIKVNTIVRVGNIFEDINKITASINGLMVVIGTHGIIGLQHIVGSRSLKLIRGSKAPYIVVQKENETFGDYKNIVLPIDFSKESKEKVVWAGYFGRHHQSKIHILTATDKDVSYARRVANNLLFTQKFLEKMGVSYEIHISDKNSYVLDRYDIQLASEVKAGLVVIMTTKHYGIDDHIIGPPEQRIINNSEKIPVMCINPRKEVVDLF